jgi:hypothetical protein
MCFLLGLLSDPSIGGSVFLRNVGELLANCTVLRTRRQSVFLIVTTRCCWCVKASRYLSACAAFSSGPKPSSRGACARRVEVTSDPLDMIDCYAFQWRANFRHVNINRNSFCSGLNLVLFVLRCFALQWTECSPSQLNLLSTAGWI